MTDQPTPARAAGSLQSRLGSSDFEQDVTQETRGGAC